MPLIKKEKSESRLIAQLFTSQAITKIADGDLSFLIKIINDFLMPKHYPVNVAKAFELAFENLSHNYKNEYFYKNILAKKMLLEKYLRKDVTMLSEFRVGENKADCVIINGISTCYEIKTRFDSLKRLPDQLHAFSKIFDKTYVVCDKSHKENVFACIPDHVGMIEFTERGSLKEIKKAGENPYPLDREILISSLRKNEYQYIAENIIKKPLNSSNINIFNDCLEIFKISDSEKLNYLFKKSMKKYRKIDSDFIEILPACLLNSAVSYKFTKSRKEGLLSILEKNIYKEKICISHS